MVTLTTEMTSCSQGPEDEINDHPGSSLAEFIDEIVQEQGSFVENGDLSQGQRQDWLASRVRVND